MTTLNISEQTDLGVLPQLRALEPVSEDNPGVGTKLGAGEQTGVQHGRGEKSGENPTRHGKAESSAKPVARGNACVFVLDKNGRPLMPTSPARARILLKKGRARVVRQTPFVIRLVDRRLKDSTVTPVDVGIDPGSRFTGISMFTTTRDNRVGLFSIEIQHRGQQIHKKMLQRAGYRRRRRTQNLRYRAPRFNNRSRPAGWLPPSLQHRVDTVSSWVRRLQKWAPVEQVWFESTRFDTHLLSDPNVFGDGYQNGTLAGTEIREYLLAKWDHQCAYCDASGVPLNIDHVVPKARGGTNRVSNLVVACITCNQRKDKQQVEEFLASDPARLHRVKAQLKAPLRDAAAVQSTRNALLRELNALDVTVRTSTGGRTKWNRTRSNLPKSHTLDAICVGRFDHVSRVPDMVLVIKASGRGQYARTTPDKYGFPRLRRPETKTVHGFQTGDHVRATNPTGKYAGTHTGRVAVRTSGYFQIGPVVTNHKHCRLLQRADGYQYETKEETVSSPPSRLGLPTATTQ